MVEIIRRTAIVLGACVLLSACQHSNEPSVPTFTSYQAQQVGAVSAGSASNGSSLADIQERLSAVQEEVFAGTDARINEQVLASGPPASGVRIVIKGSAIDDGLFGEPVQAIVSTAGSDGATTQRKELEMKADESGDYSVSTDLHCSKQVDLTLTMHALKGGDGDIQVFVYPTDKGGASSAVFKHSYSVRSESDDDQNSSESD